MTCSAVCQTKQGSLTLVAVEMMYRKHPLVAVLVERRANRLATALLLAPHRRGKRSTKRVVDAQL
jgi:hypothetical protein